MALVLRQKQIDAVVRMLNLNVPVASGGTADEEVYKVLLLDKFSRDLISPLLRVNELRKHGVTLYLMVDSDRQNIPDVPAVYFVQPTPANIQRITLDASRGVYDKFHLNFTSSLPRPLLEELAAGVLKADAMSRIAKVYDQYTEFISLGTGIFSLAQPKAYLNLNDPKVQDKDIEAAIEGIVSGLFCVLATMGVVPIIRCSKNGPAEMVARQLDERIRAHLVSQNNLFKEAGGHLGSMYQRPLLCIFDRNFELAVGIQHSFSYRPLVHDVLGMRLNKVVVHQSASSAAQSAMRGKPPQTVHELDESDAFWAAHCSSPFPKAAEEVDLALKKWKQDKEEVSKQPGVDFDDEDLAQNTKHLTAAMSAVPEMLERKAMIDKHVTLGGALLEDIKARAIDAFYSLEEDLLTRGSVDKAAMLNLLRTRGNNEDKVRLAIVYLLASESTPSADLEAVEAALKEAECDTSALEYIKRIRRLNLNLASATHQGSKDDLLDWAGKLYGQGISRVTAGVKNLLSAGRQLAVTRAVEALMEAKPVPEFDSYLTLDPRASKASAAAPRGPYKDAIVFTIGGGNYLEYGSLVEYAQRQQPPKNIIYGSTDILSPKEFLSQLGDLGRKMAESSSSAS
eukprot:jgi/Mesen1/10066/ME000730S09340